MKDYNLDNYVEALDFRNAARKKVVKDAWILSVPKEDLNNAKIINNEKN